MRSRLAQRRRQVTVDIEVDGRVHSVAVGVYGHGGAGEVFIAGAKAGSHYQAVLDDAGILMSLLMQHSVSASDIAVSLGRTEDGQRTSVLGAAADLAASLSNGVA